MSEKKFNSSSTGSLLIVVGMPGSGKTTYLKKLLSRSEIDACYDDYQMGAPEGEMSNPRKSPNYEALLARLALNEHVAITDIRYCLPDELDVVKTVAQADWPDVELRTVFFENNPTACKHNVLKRYRAEDRVRLEFEYIDRYTELYNPPIEEVITVIMG